MANPNQDRERQVPDPNEIDEEPAADEKPTMDRPEDSLDAPEDADFAEEHTKPTFADEQAGGPEGVKEPESPKGRAGDGGMDPG